MSSRKKKDIDSSDKEENIKQEAKEEKPTEKENAENKKTEKKKEKDSKKEEKESLEEGKLEKETKEENPEDEEELDNEEDSESEEEKEKSEEENKDDEDLDDEDEQNEDDDEDDDSKSEEELDDKEENSENEEIDDDKENNITSKKSQISKLSKKIDGLSRRELLITILIVVLIFIIIMAFAIALGLRQSHKNEEANNNLFDKNKIAESELDENQSKFLGLSGDKYNTTNFNTYNDDRHYTKYYKKYLKLSDKEKKELEVIPREEEIAPEILEDLEDEIVIESDLPDSFNLSEEIPIHVSNQGEFGLCWDFASTKSVETFLAINENEDYDFAEIHPDYITSENMYANQFLYRFLHEGGNFAIYENYLKLSGPVLEDELPYQDYDEPDFSKFIDMEPVVNVTETVNFPASPALDEDATAAEVENFRNLIKSHIMKNGSLYAVTDAEKFVQMEDGNVTQYCHNDECWPNHAISIVGWDDNYTKYNFMDENGKSPENDGAYIALNSWGEEWGNQGYFYISYEDVLVEAMMSGILSTSYEDSIEVNSISNDKLRKYLTDRYGHLFRNVDGVDYLRPIITNVYDTVDLSNLNLTSDDLEDVARIFPNAFSLSLKNNNITDVSALSNLKTTYVIGLEDNNISDITPLANNINLEALRLKGNNISDVSILENFPNLTVLNISDNPIDWNTFNLSSNTLWSLSISNTGFKDLGIIKDLTDLFDLDISGNPITSLNGLGAFELFTINVSNNNIKDWQALNNIPPLSAERTGEVLGIPYSLGLIVEAENCNIDDISVFNDVNAMQLHLANNNIKDASKYNNSKVSYVDLSNNPGIKNLEGLRNVSSIILAHNKLTDLNEVLKLENVSSLDLSYNNIKDWSSLKELNNLGALSIEGNKDIDLKDIPDNLFTLNVKDCDLNNTNDFSKFNNLQLINISDNPNITNIASIINNLNEESYIEIYGTGYTMPASEYEKVYPLEGVVLHDISVKLDRDSSSDQITLNYGDVFNRAIMSNMLLSNFNTKDIKVNKNARELYVTGNNPQIIFDTYKLVAN